MSESAGEKTEQPTPKRQDEALKKGQFARSPDVQTVFVLGGSLLGLYFCGLETWHLLINLLGLTLGHLHETTINTNNVQSYFIRWTLIAIQCVWPVVAGAIIGGLLAGGIQTRFQTASEALTPDLERLNPINGFNRIFSLRGTISTGLNLFKLGAIIALSYSTIMQIAQDPIFFSPVDVARIAGFMTESTLKIFLRILLILCGIAALDYAYQFWKNQKDMMMSKEEVKEESKSSEGNPQIKAAQRRRRQQISMRKMLTEVPQADVIVTNPTHFAIALRYDAKTMKAPKILAKGTRLNALRIRKIAQQHKVPIVENKPVARLLFKYGRVGGEVPAQLYVIVAEILAWVYRTNRSRYYLEANRPKGSATVLSEADILPENE